MAAVTDFFRSRWFDSRHKTKLHVAQLILVVLTIGLAAARISAKPAAQPMSRSDMISISMGAKTIIVLLYQVITEHAARFRRWASLKAYVVLNALEIVFWFAVVVLTLMGVSKFCQGASCVLAWIVTLLAAVLSALSFWTAVISWNNFRASRKQPGIDGADVVSSQNLGSCHHRR